MTNHYHRQNERLSTQERFRDEIEPAQQRDGLALNRANVDLCGDALLAGVRDRACRALIHEAAERDLFGWTSND